MTLFDLSQSRAEQVKSEVMHLIFTPKGQKLRDPDFGTSLIDYVFGPKTDEMFSAVKSEITAQVGKYVPAAQFKDINIYTDETDEHGIIVSITYSVKIGNKTEDTTVAIKL